jgi:hypothetical protein
MCASAYAPSQSCFESEWSLSPATDWIEGASEEKAIVTRNGYQRRFYCMWESARYAPERHFESLPIPVFFAELLGTFLRFIALLATMLRVQQGRAHSWPIRSTSSILHTGHIIEFVSEFSRFRQRMRQADEPRAR